MNENLERNMWVDYTTPVDSEHMNKITNKIISNSDDITRMSQAMVGLQPKNDNSLETANKNIPSAINELKREKFDKVTISNNVLKFYANNIEKFSIILPENQETDLTEINNSLATKYDNVVLEGQNLKFYVGSTLKKTITLPVGEGGGVDLSGYVTDAKLTEALQSVDATTLNGKKFSEPMSQEEYDAITNKDENTIYLIDNDSAIVGVPDYSTDDADKVLAVNSAGNGIEWVVNNGTGGGSGSYSSDINTIISSATNTQPSVYNAKPLRPLVSFVDDDGRTGVYTKWKGVIESKNVPISMCIITGKVGTTGYMTWEQIKDMQNTHNCEVLSHTVTHNNISMHDTNKTWIEELKSSKNSLISHGLDVRGFAYPNGGFWGTKEGVVDGTTNGYWMTGLFYDYGIITDGIINTHPLKNGNMGISRIGIGCYETAESKTLDGMKALVDRCVAENGWLVFMTHVDDVNHTEEDTTNLGLLIDYIKGKGVDIVTMSEGFEIFGNAVETPNCKITKQGNANLEITTSVPDATRLTKGIVKVGDGLAVDEGVISVDSSLYYSKSYLDEVLDTMQSEIDNLKNNGGGGDTNSAPIISTISNINASPSSDFVISYTAIDSDGISVHELSTDGGSKYSSITPVAGEGNAFSHTMSLAEEGTYYCKLRVTDSLGNSTIKSFSVIVAVNKIILNAFAEKGGTIVDANSGIYQVNNTTNSYDSVILFDSEGRLEVDGTYTLCVEVVEATMDVNAAGVGTTYAVTKNNSIFNNALKGGTGVVTRIPFTVYALPNSKTNRLVYFQIGNSVEGEGFIKIKAWVEV